MHTAFFLLIKYKPHSLTKRYINQSEATKQEYTYKLDEGGGPIIATCSDLTHQRTSSKSDGLNKPPNSELGAPTGPVDSQCTPLLTLRSRCRRLPRTHLQKRSMQRPCQTCRRSHHGTRQHNHAARVHHHASIVETPLHHAADARRCQCGR